MIMNKLIILMMVSVCEVSPFDGKLMICDPPGQYGPQENVIVRILRMNTIGMGQ